MQVGSRSSAAWLDRFARRLASMRSLQREVDHHVAFFLTDAISRMMPMMPRPPFLAAS